MEATRMNDERGCSLCAAGKENYRTFRHKDIARRREVVYYQYDYRHTDGQLFSCVAKSLNECREKRDKWLESKKAKNG